MMRTAGKPTLLKGSLPARNRPGHDARTALFSPFTHVRHLKQSTVGHRLHPFTLTARTTVHTGGNLQSRLAEMVLGVKHMPFVGGLQNTIAKRRFAVRQPQRGIDHVQIIIKQREAQIVRANAVGTMFIHAQRRHLPGALFQLAVKRREASVETHHQRQIFTRRQRHQPLRIVELIGKRFIHADMNAGVQQFAHYRVVRGCRAVHKDRVALRR